MRDPWGIGGFRGGGGEKTNIKQIVKKKSVIKSERAAKSEKFGYFFVSENGLKCIYMNPTKHL